MILHRLPDSDLVYTYTGTPNTEVDIVLSDNTNTADFAVSGTTDESGGLIIDLNSLKYYDRALTLHVYDVNANLLFEDLVEIVRPYATPGPTATDVDEFYKQERIARGIIDSITGGFYFKRRIISYDALGGDMLALQSGIHRIVRGWENGVKVFDIVDPGFVNSIEFNISKDRTAIIVDTGNEYNNRLQGNDTHLAWAPSDYYSYGWVDGSGSSTYPYRQGEFALGGDYLFDVEYGYKFLPSDVSLAVELMMKAGLCNDEYLNRYITEYDTDQYRIKYGSDAQRGTGNRQVDMILAKYMTALGNIRVGVI